MTQYNTLDVKVLNSQLNKLKPGIKDSTEVTLNLSKSLVRNSHNKTNFPHRLLLTNTQVLRLQKAFPNDSSADIKFSRTHLLKMV